MSDNCSVIKGRNNSLVTRIKEKAPAVFNSGCMCHLANMCTVAGMKPLALPVEDLLVEVFHFYHSSNLKERYKGFLDFTDTEPMKILKPCKVTLIHMRMWRSQEE
jgi:hypothetical protein